MRKPDEDVMTDEVRLEEIHKVLDRLHVLAADHVLLIEGKKDRASLEAIGLSGDMFQIQSGGGPVKAVEYVMRHGRKAVVLTDWDRKGGIIAASLVRLLSASDLVYDVQVRIDLSRLCRHYIKDVESFDVLVERLGTLPRKLL